MGSIIEFRARNREKTMRLLYNEMVIKMASGIGIQTTRWNSNLINTLFNLHGTSEKS